MLEANLPMVLILEDDAAPAAHYDPARLRSVATSLSEEAELIFFGCMIMGGLADRPAHSKLARLYYFNGTFAYLITPPACKALLPRLLPLRSHIDHQISSILIDQRHILAAYYRRATPVRA